jgi:PAS domain S-box-containing protein
MMHFDMAMQHWLTELAPQGILATDAELRIRSWNRWLESHSGLPAAKLLGRPLFEAFPEMAARGLERYYRQALAGQVVVLAQSLHGFLIELAAPTGQLAFGRMQQSARIAPLMNAGEIVGTVTVIEDVTERVARDAELARQLQALERARAEAEVAQAVAAESESRYRAIGESIPFGVWMCDANGLVTYASETFLALRGATLGDCVQAGPLGWLPAEERADALVAWREAAARGVLWDHEFRLAGRDGRAYVVLSRGVRVQGPGGRLAGWAGINLDITARKRAEDRAHFLSEAAALLAASVDYRPGLERVLDLAVPRLADAVALALVEDGRRLRLVALRDADPAREAQVREQWERQPPTPERPVGLCHSAFTGGPDVAGDSAPALRPDGARANPGPAGYGLVLDVPLVVRGETIGALAVAIPVAHEPDTRDELALAEDLAHRLAMVIDSARLYDELQEAIRARERFFSIASHELRTPVTIMHGYVQGLQRLITRQAAEPERPDTVRLNRARVLGNLERLETGTRRLSTLVAELFDLSRLLEGKRAPALQRVNLSELITGVIENASVQQTDAAGAPVILQADLPQEPVWGHWDPGQIEQVLVNLIDNAIKYSPSGGRVVVALNVESQASGGDRAHITIRDEGIGIPSEHLPRLFAPFARAENARARRLPGMGLGLTITKEIVDQHAGAIWAESAGTGKGSTFHLVLPLRAAVDVADQEVGARRDA